MIFKPSIDLEDRVIVITGASGGIGASVALVCGTRKMRVVIAARSADRLTGIAHEIKALGGQALICPTDIRHPEQMDALADRAVTHFGRIDILLANAGIGCHAGVAQASAEEMTDVIQTNLLGVMYGARAVLPTMLAQGSGHILTVSSVVVGLMWPDDAIYAASKAGVHRFSRGLRNEAQTRGIQVTDIVAGVIDTPLTAGLRGFPKADVTATARSIVAVMERPRPVLVTPGWYRLALAVNALLPGSIDALLARPHT